MDELTRKMLEYDEAHFMCCFYENRIAIKDVLIQLFGLIATLEKNGIITKEDLDSSVKETGEYNSDSIKALEGYMKSAIEKREKSKKELLELKDEIEKENEERNELMKKLGLEWEDEK